MPNLMTHLKKVSEQKPQATYYNVDMLKYQVRLLLTPSSAQNLCVPCGCRVEVAGGGEVLAWGPPPRVPLGFEPRARLRCERTALPPLKHLCIRCVCKMGFLPSPLRKLNVFSVILEGICPGYSVYSIKPCSELAV